MKEKFDANSIFELLCASVNLICSSRLLFNTESLGIIHFKVVTKISNGERDVLPVICCASSAEEEVNKLALITVFGVFPLPQLTSDLVFLQSKPTNYWIKFVTTLVIMTKKMIINREVISIEVIKNSLLGICWCSFGGHTFAANYDWRKRKSRIMESIRPLVIA